MVLTLSAIRAGAEAANYGQPLIPARFDQLIPTTYPIIRPGFDRLIERSRPVIHPGVAQVPITENLVRPLDQPLLIVNGSGRSYPQPTRNGKAALEPRQTLAVPHALKRSKREIRTLITY
jgi:hypothetical protein